MVKHIELMGMEIPNYSLREEITCVEEALKNTELNIFLTVSMEYLVLAGHENPVKDSIRQAKLLIIDDKEILSVAGIHSSQRIHEASEHVFFTEMMKRLVRSQREVFLVADTKEELNKARDILEGQFDRLRITGQYALEDHPDDYDHMINEMNGCAPDVILSIMDSPEQERFLMEHKGKIGAKIWYGLGMHYQQLIERKGFGWKLRKLIHFGRFKMHVNHYQESEK